MYKLAARKEKCSDLNWYKIKVGQFWVQLVVQVILL